MGDFNYSDIDGYNKCAANHKGKPMAGGRVRLIYAQHVKSLKSFRASSGPSSRSRAKYDK